MIPPFLTLPNIPNPHEAMSGTAELSFSFSSTFGPSVVISNIEFYQVIRSSINLEQIHLDGGLQQLYGDDQGMVKEPKFEPALTKDLPPGFMQVKGAE